MKQIIMVAATLVAFNLFANPPAGKATGAHTTTPKAGKMAKKPTKEQATTLCEEQKAKDAKIDVEACVAGMTGESATATH